MTITEKIPASLRLRSAPGEFNNADADVALANELSAQLDRQFEDMEGAERV
jgi:hypothetical protein